MFKTLYTDRYTLERKFHNPDEPFNAFNRMDYHGYDYDTTTGLDDETINVELEKLSDSLKGQPHPVIKSKLFEYILDNTMIDVNEYDYFIGIYSWGRLLSKHTVLKWNEDVLSEFKQASDTINEFFDSGICFGWLDFDHTVPDWDSIMKLGFSGLLNRIEKSYDQLKESGSVTPKQEAFFSGLKTEYEAILRLIDRLYKYALTKKFDKANKIAKCLKNLRDGAPTDTYEALQLIYIYFMISESVDHYQVRSLGYGLDSTLYPFYKKDIESGKYTKDEIAELLGYFLMQWASIGNYWGQPFYLGGTNTDGTTKVNELSELILEVYDHLKIYNPKIQIKVDKSTPKYFVLKALNMIRGGNSSIVFCNSDIITKCLMSRGATYEEAVDSVISGCYEYKAKNKDIGISVTYFNALAPVSLVIDNGYSTVLNKQIGLYTGEANTIGSFNEFYNAYLAQLEHAITTFLDSMITLESKVNDINPSLVFSGTMANCVKNLTDALDCGIENTTDFLLSGLGSAVDALMAVYDLVFEKKITTLSELKKALDSNWVGYEDLRKLALSCKHKFGNGDPMADNYAAAITRFVHNIIANKKNAHGGQIIFEMHSARAFIIHGESTKATPDGRKAGQETSKNASPAPGSDSNGITALINSATQIDTTLCNSGFCLDAMLHPSAISGDDGLLAFYSVLNTYMNKGGASIHFNIFDVDMLRDAQKNPDKYKNLQVRVCGWNVLWNNMDKSEQDAYILRAENI